MSDSSNFRETFEGSVSKLLDVMPEALLFVDEAGRIAYANIHACRLFGYPQDELVGADVEVLLPEAFRDSHRRHRDSYFSHAIARPMGRSINLLGLTRDGREFSVEVSLSPVETDDGILVSAAVRDVTSYKHAEEALHWSERNLADAQRIALIGSWELNLMTGEEKWSDQMYRLVGPEPNDSELTSKTFFEFVHWEDQENLRKTIEKTIETGASYNADYRIVRRDGTNRYIHEEGEIAEWQDGKPVRVIGVTQDITERKLSEMVLKETNARAVTTHARLNSAIEVINQGFALFDADDRLVLCNNRYRDIVCPGEQDFVRIGATFEEIIREVIARGMIRDADDDSEAWVVKRLAEHREPTGTRLEYNRLGKWLQVTERTTEEGGIVAIYEDVTKDKNVENEIRSANEYLDNQSRELEEMTEHLIQARDQAELANRTKSEFLANMSHELRTPLNAVIGFSDVINREMFGPVGNSKYLEYAHDINESGLHLLELINDILDMSKIEAGKIDLHEENIDVSRVLGSCLTLIRERATEGGIKIKCDIPSTLAALYADERKFKQILINLLSNAIKFTPSGGKVMITFWSRRDSGYVFQVADTGIGIALSDIPKVLTPFQQVDSDLNRKFDGTGLGLPLTKALTELHGGTLGLQSEVGVGTTVTVRFPAERIVWATNDDSASAAE
jgi:two-component system, cell cycle sensor histidine kinase PleC